MLNASPLMPKLARTPDDSSSSSIGKGSGVAGLEQEDKVVIAISPSIKNDTICRE